MEFLLIFGGVCLVGWFLDKLGEKPPPPLPKTPQQLEQERLERARKEEEIRQLNLRIQQEREASREEWRSKYRKYRQSSKWKRVRKKVLETADYTCAFCGRPATQVHHRKYTRGHKAGEFKRENYDYLVAICAKCHMEKHEL